MDNEEIWLPAPGLEGQYEVSNLGRLRYVGKSGEWGRVRQFTGEGYQKLLVRQGGRHVPFYVHRMVCEAFHGPPPTSDHQAAHDDGDTANNRETNLIWKTGAENLADRDRHGTMLRGEKAPSAKLTEEQVQMIRTDPRPQRQIAAAFGVTQTTVHHIKAGKRWKGPAT